MCSTKGRYSDLCAAGLTCGPEVGIAKLSAPCWRLRSSRMKSPSSMSRLKGFRFPREMIAYAVWA